MWKCYENETSSVLIVVFEENCVKFCFQIGQNYTSLSNVAITVSIQSYDSLDPMIEYSFIQNGNLICQILTGHWYTLNEPILLLIQSLIFIKKPWKVFAVKNSSRDRLIFMSTAFSMDTASAVSGYMYSLSVFVIILVYSVFRLLCVMESILEYLITSTVFAYNL